MTRCYGYGGSTLSMMHSTRLTHPVLVGSLHTGTPQASKSARVLPAHSPYESPSFSSSSQHMFHPQTHSHSQAQTASFRYSGMATLSPRKALAHVLYSTLSAGSSDTNMKPNYAPLAFSLNDDDDGSLGDLNATGTANENSEDTQAMLAPTPKRQSASIIFTILAALAITISYADRSNLSTAIIPMAQEFHWDTFFSGIVLSSFWGGYALTQVIGGRLADRFGGEKVLLLGLVLWSLCTALTPIAAGVGGSAVILLIRVLLGAGEGLALPAVHSMTRKYVAPGDRSSSVSIVTAACYFGALISNLCAPAIISAYNWQLVFYLFAFLPAVVWLPLWLRFTSTTAKSAIDYSSVVDANTKPSKYSVQESGSEGTMTIAQLLKKPPVWAILAAQYGQSWGMIGLLSWLPTYYSDKFGVPIAELGSFTVIPYLLQLIVAVISGFAADKAIASGIRTLTVRNVLQVVGMLAPALCLGYCAYAPALSAIQAMILITVGSALSSTTVAAVSSNHFDISPKNAGTIFGIGNTASCIGGLIAVPVSGYIFDLTHSWNAVFALFAVHYIGGALVWLAFASDKPLEHAEPAIP